VKIQLVMEGRLRTVVLEAGIRPGSFVGELDGERVEFDAVGLMPGVVSLVWKGRSFRCVLREDGITVDGREVEYQVHDPRSLATRRKRADTDTGTLLLKATMAGRVVRVIAGVGDAVEAHGGVVVIEAMKMQNELRTPRAGTVVELKVAAGEMVSSGQVLAVIE
jgi:biotin carboxyl carrier protein